MLRVLALSLALPAIALAQNAEPPVAAEPTPDEAPVQAPPPAAPVPQKVQPTQVKQSWGDGTIGLNLQGWFWASSDPRFFAGYTNSYSGQKNAGTSTFRLRRAEMSYDGKVAEIVKYRLMIDPTQIWNGNQTVTSTGTVGTGGKVSVTGTVAVKDILQDAYVGAMVPYHEVRLGQFKLPITMEGYGSSSKLDFAERSIMGRTFGDQRDIGVMVLSDGLPYVEYEAAIVNGTGKNVYDNSPHKAGVARLVVKPYPGIAVGGSGEAAQLYDPSAGTTRHQNRAGAEAALEMYGVSLKAEYMKGVTGVYDSTAKALTTLKPAGYYGTLGYRFLPGVQGVVRYEHFDSDTSTSTDDCKTAAGASSAPFTDPASAKGRCFKARVITAGVNYDFAPAVLNGVKLQLDYLNDRDEVSKTSANGLCLVAQMKF